MHLPPTPCSQLLVSSSRRDRLSQDITTPPSTASRKRKADDIADHLAPSAAPPTKKPTPDLAVDLPATPVTTTASPKMDSDDDFNSSQASGEDFMDDQDSDLGLEDGKAP